MLKGMLATALLSAHLAAVPADKELVVLILVDAMRADHVGTYGYDRPTTPILDELAKRGTRYARMYANAPWTRASTASFFTSLNASRHRTETETSKLPPNVDTVAGRLRAAGWQTTGFSANGNGGSLAGLDRDFDLFEDPTNAYQRRQTSRRCKKKYGAVIPNARLSEAIREDCKRYVGLPTGEFIVHRALEHLRSSKAKREYLFLFLVDPHDWKFSYHAPAELERQFLGKALTGKRPTALWEKDNDYSAEDRRILRSLYDAGIRYSDIAIGQFLEGLEALGLRENTTLFVTADHGEGFGEHDFYLHAHHFWEEVIHVPLIVVGPRFEPAVDHRVTQAIDVAATILDLAGADRSGILGRTLLAPSIEGARVISEYNEFGIHRQAIVGERYKVIWQRPADVDWYLSSFSNRFSVEEKKAFFPSVVFDEERVRVFDLKSDPQEKHDLNASMPAEATAMLADLRAFVAASEKLAVKEASTTGLAAPGRAE